MFFIVYLEDWEMEEFMRDRFIKIRRGIAGMFAILLALSGIQMDCLRIKANDGKMVTLYFMDNTAEHWVKNNEAVMELVDNTNGHNKYEMTTKDNTTWSVSVPNTAYNVTFNRYDSGKATQWNSWSAGGRDENNAYYADGSEYGHWGNVEDSNENYFHAGDIVYLDVSEFKDWKISDALMYVNFDDVSKVEPGDKDVNILAEKESGRYKPQITDYEIEDNVYTYIVTKQDEGKEVLRFWRGNETTLWNCTITLEYKQFKGGSKRRNGNCLYL